MTFGHSVTAVPRGISTQMEDSNQTSDTSYMIYLNIPAIPHPSIPRSSLRNWLSSTCLWHACPWLRKAGKRWFPQQPYAPSLTTVQCREYISGLVLLPNIYWCRWITHTLSMSAGSCSVVLMCQCAKLGHKHIQWLITSIQSSRYDIQLLNTVIQLLRCDVQSVHSIMQWLHYRFIRL